MRKVGIVLMFAVLIMFASNISATIINVPGDQPNIQAGIDASFDGDTVRVATGTYVENIDFSGKNIVVGSWFLDDGDTSFISSTIIDGNQSGRIVTFQNGEDNTAVITGFTIQNGSEQYRGGGIACESSSPTISYNTISGNFGGYTGGGIFCSYSDPIISNNTISGNTVSYEGGGIHCYNSSPAINYNTINANSAPQWGGGIFCYNSSPAISNNTITGNSGYKGGGIYCEGNSNPTISNNTISGNSADDDGGGIFCEDSNPMISNNTISGNTVNYWMDSGIYCKDSSPVITNTIFWGNTPYEPEIILDGSSSPVITYCDVQGSWEGEGNIDCDPMFCDPENGNFYLDANSCCVGAGEGGVDIGAFGVGCGEEIPTLSEWGMIVMALLLLSAGTIAVIRRRRAVAA